MSKSSEVSIAGPSGPCGSGHDPRNFGKVVVDDECYSPSMVKALIAELDAALAQNAELVAKIDAIKDAWMAAGSWPNTVEEKQAIANAINATPTQCLRDIQAEAGRAGFLEGVRQMAENEIGWFGNDADSCANHYALRVKAGGV